MKCDKCGFILPDGSKFCTACGSGLQSTPSSEVDKTVMVNRPQPSAYQPVQPTPTPPPYQPVQPTPPPYQPVQPTYGQPIYGQPTPPPYQPVQPMYGPHPAEGTATTAMVLGILSFFCGGLILSILAIVLGNNALKQGYPGGKAKTGVTCGTISLILYVVFLVIYFAILGASL